MLEIRTLGGLSINLDGQPVTAFQSDKVRALLANLVVESENPHRRETLAGLLWPDYPERSARTNLRNALANLRQVIRDREATPPFLRISRQSIQFNSESDSWADVKAFTNLLDACKAHTHPRLEVCDQCKERLQEAVSLYQGDFLSGFSLADSPAFEEWALLERERLGRLVTDALLQLASLHEARGEYESALQHSRRMLELDPLAEEVHRQVMRVLAHQGQRSAVVAQYQTCCRILEEELGVEPEPETTALYEKILAGGITATPEDDAAPPHNLPHQLIPFVGRKTELAELSALLADTQLRLVTVVGPGGMGKTRLALEAAAAQLNLNEHGVFFVSLAPLRSAEGIVPTVADALGFSFYGGVEPRQQLLDYLRGKNLLLLMDNYEHLLESVDLVSDVLKTAPGVKVLVTSRARLNLQGEQLYPLSGMEHPDWETPEDAAQYSAVELFLLSARRVRPDFALRGDDLTHLTRICRSVGGMPLAILLAAGWVDMLNTAEIASQIARSLDFLETETRDVPERQRSIRAVFDYSWQSLTEREREVFQGLSVFRGGFAADAAQAVTGASLRQLRVLVDKSLIGSDRVGRFEIHALLRQYAQERIGKSPTTAQSVRDHHCAYYAAALERWGKDLKGARQQFALEEMRTDIENARTAWEWAVGRKQVDRLDQTVDGLCLFYNRRGHVQEGEAACRVAVDKLAAMASGDGPVTPSSKAERVRVLAKLLAWQGHFKKLSGHPEAADELLRKSLNLLDDPILAELDTRAERAQAFHLLSSITEVIGDWVESSRLDEISLALNRSLGDKWAIGGHLTQAGSMAARSGAYAKGQRLVEEGLALRRALGDQWGMANSLVNLGSIAREQGRLHEAERFARESIAIRNRIGHRGFELGVSHLCLAETVVRGGKFPEAHALCQETLSLCEDLGFPFIIQWSNLLLGDAKQHLGHIDAARALAQTALTHFRESGERVFAPQSLYRLGLVALTQEAYDEAQQLLQESADLMREIGHRGVLGQIIAAQSIASRGKGQLSRGCSHVCEALRLGAETRHIWTLVDALPAAALLLADKSEAEQAAEIYALASRYPYVANSRWFEDVAGKHIAAAAATLPPDVVSAAQQRGRTRELSETAEELLAELEGNKSAI
jgi:predicted ATPase/DNA-binding SARP family transcriptional activator